MDARKWLNSTFLKVEDLKNGSIEGTIVAVREGEKFDRPVIELEDGTRVSLNQTSLKAMIRAYTDDTEEWINKLVKLYLGKTTFKGEPTDSILLEPLSPKVEPKPKPKSKAKAKLGKPDMDDEIGF